jgi:CarD family transcriptional regulator
MEKTDIYSKGDWIVHNNYGIGKIDGLEKKILGGKERLYYRVECNSGTFWLSVNRAESDRVRPVASREKLKEAIKALREEPQKLHKNYKQRQSHIREIRSEGSLVSIAGLVRDLSYGKAEKALNTTDQGMLDEMEKRLIMEWSVIMDIEPEAAHEKLNELLPTNGA